MEKKEYFNGPCHPLLLPGQITKEGIQETKKVVSVITGFILLLRSQFMMFTQFYTLST